jgi:FtsH-binding integral membrane protein
MSAYGNEMGYQPYGATIAAQAAQTERVAFLQRTYVHLAGAIIAFGLIELLIFGLVGSERLEPIISPLFRGWTWLVVVGAFMGVSWLAEYWATSGASRTMQYAGLSLYVVAEALIFVPILWIAGNYFPGAIESAGISTMVIFLGLTAIVLGSKADFSFLRYALYLGGLASFAAIIAAIVMGFSLGIWFSIAMVVLISGMILYQTSNMLHHYRTDQHVAAALGLFASVATMFWYLIQIFMRSDD